MTDSKLTAVVVGAGVGGIAAAVRLAKAGFQVTVLEKNDFTGGRCSLLYKDGYRFDQGPSLLLLPDLFRETFADIGTTIEGAGVDLVKCEPNYRVHFHDGVEVTLSTDIAVMKHEIEKLEGKDGFEQFLAYLQEGHRHYELSVKHVLAQNFTSLLSMARPAFLKHIADLHPFQSIWDRASIYFKTERLRRVFTFGSMYMGMSPFDAPGTYSLLQYTELAEGIWYPKGGFHSVIQALINSAEAQKLDITYRLSTPVASIDVDPQTQTATGVRVGHSQKMDDSQSSFSSLELDDEIVSADVVVCNADLVYSHRELLPVTTRREQRQVESLEARKASCSSISFYWGLDRIIPELSAHNVFLAEQYHASFADIFTHQRMPAEPSFYVNVPSRVDAAAAPAGCDAVVVLVPCGHLDRADPHGVDWAAAVDAAREKVLKVLAGRLGLAELGKWIVSETVNTPQTWQDKFNLDRGAILGLSHGFFNVLSFRPPTRHPDIARCYFVGASTHPGTGVPICLAGAKLTATQVLDDFGVPVPWGAPRAHGVPPLHKSQQPNWVWGTLVHGLLVLMALLMSLVMWATGIV